jgi:hypothetical protein
MQITRHDSERSPAPRRRSPCAAARRRRHERWQSLALASPTPKPSALPASSQGPSRDAASWLCRAALSASMRPLIAEPSKLEAAPGQFRELDASIVSRPNTPISSSQSERVRAPCSGRSLHQAAFERAFFSGETGSWSPFRTPWWLCRPGSLRGRLRLPSARALRKNPCGSCPRHPGRGGSKGRDCCWMRVPVHSRVKSASCVRSSSDPRPPRDASGGTFLPKIQFDPRCWPLLMTLRFT